MPTARVREAEVDALARERVQIMRGVPYQRKARSDQPGARISRSGKRAGGVIRLKLPNAPWDALCHLLAARPRGWRARAARPPGRSRATTPSTRDRPEAAAAPARPRDETIGTRSLRCGIGGFEVSDDRSLTVVRLFAPIPAWPRSHESAPSAATNSFALQHHAVLQVQVVPTPAPTRLLRTLGWTEHFDALLRAAQCAVLRSKRAVLHDRRPAGAHATRKHRIRACCPGDHHRFASA